MNIVASDSGAVAARQEVVELRLNQGEKLEVDVRQYFNISTSTPGIVIKRYDPDVFQVVAWPNWIKLNEKKAQLVGRVPTNFAGVQHIWLSAYDPLDI